MATTTNYSWTTPDDTALVKDGASAIRSLGSAIDSSLAGLKTAAISSVDASVANPAGTAFAASAGTDPSVTITTGTRALVILEARINCVGNFNFMGFAVSGATTIAATDADSANLGGVSAYVLTSFAKIVTGLTAGSNTFTMRYRCNVSASGSYEYRKLIVIPLP
jgi:hypothetical protein